MAPRKRKPVDTMSDPAESAYAKAKEDERAAFLRGWQNVTIGTTFPLEPSPMTRAWYRQGQHEGREYVKAESTKPQQETSSQADVDE